MTEHSKVLSFSSAYRIMECPASVRMSHGQGDDEQETNAAMLGTAAHALGEYCIQFGFNTGDCIGLEFNTITVDENMANAVEIYVGRVRMVAKLLNVKPLVEQRVVMYSLGRDDVFGTADCIIIDLVHRRLYIMDYKHGYLPVNVVKNPQLIGYAIAALDTFKLWDLIDEVETTIVQPRCQHISGPIRIDTYTVKELLDVWFPMYVETVRRIDDVNDLPVAGKQCEFCPARANCRMRLIRLLDTAYGFRPIDSLSNQEIEIMYGERDNIRRYLDELERMALRMSHSGYNFKNYKRVQAIQRAKCTDEEALVACAKKHNVNLDKLYNKNPIGMTAAKKLLPAKEVDKFYTKPDPTYTLAPMTDSRPAQSQKLSTIFGKIE